jgi:hypothetical protein
MNVQRGILTINEVEELRREKYNKISRDSVAGSRKIRIPLIF